MIKFAFSRIVMLNILTLVTLNAFAQTSPPFTTDLGFNRLSHPSTPAMLPWASKSVFEVRIVSEDILEDIQTWDLTAPEYSQVDSKIESSPVLDDKEKIIIKRQISNCRNRGNEKQCSVFMGFNKGTAFLAGKGGLLWTNAHVIDRFVKIITNLRKQSVSEWIKRDGRLLIFLFDANGKLVFDPFTDSAIVKINPNVSKAEAGKEEWYSVDSDYVGIQLSRSLGTPLRIGNPPIPGENLYRPGYPVCTGCPQNSVSEDPERNRNRGLGRNSDGVGLYWTGGAAQRVDSIISFLGVDPRGNYDLGQMVLFSADSQLGLSGGPILNTQGEVVGIFAGSKQRVYDSSMVVLSRGVRPPAFESK